MKPDEYKNLVSGNEQIIKIFEPESFLRRLFYSLGKRVALIITNKRIVCRGNFKYSDKSIGIEEISDVFLTNESSAAVWAAKSLEILKKGTPPIDSSVLRELISDDVIAPVYRGYISVRWLSGPKKDEALAMIKKLIGRKNN